MSAVTSEGSAGPAGAPAKDCLATGRWGGRIVMVLFVVSIAVFVLAVLTLGPGA